MHTPLSKDIDWFLEYLAARPASPRTISTYRSSLAHLLRFAVNRGCTSADQLTDDLVRAAAVDLMRRAAVALADNERARAKGNEGAARLMVVAARSLCRALKTERRLDAPDLRVAAPRLPERLQPRVLADDFVSLERALVRRAGRKRMTCFRSGSLPRMCTRTARAPGRSLVAPLGQALRQPRAQQQQTHTFANAPWIGRGAPEAVGRVVVAAAQLARWVGACGAGYCSSGIGWHSPPRLGASNTKPPQLEDDVLEPGGLRRAPARGREVARMLVARGCHDKAAVTSRSQFPTSVVVSARSTAASMCLANASVWSPGSGRRFSRRKVTPTM